MGWTMRRRDFLQQTSLALAGIALTDSIFSRAWAAENISLWANGELSRVPILQGATSDTATQFTVLRNITRPFVLRLMNANGELLSYDHEVLTSLAGGGSRYEVLKIYVRGLKPNTDYRLQVIDLVSGALRDERVFQTLDIRNRRSLKFAVVSCMSDEYFASGDQTWPALLQEKPEVVFIIGDAAYINHGDKTPESFWNMHVQSRIRISYYYAPRLIPTMLMWDDHDFGHNDGDSSFAMKNTSLKIWDAFFGSKSIVGVYDNGPGTNGVFTAFGQNFFLLDDRTFLNKGQKNQSLWGAEGDEFLFARLESTALPSFLMNGVQYFGGYLLGSESFEKEHRVAFKNILGRLSKIESPVVFVSGDVHFSEVMKIEKEILGYETLEITSSSMHSSIVPGQQFRSYNKRRLMSTSVHNFVIIESSVQDSGKIKMNLKSVSAKNRVRFSHQAEIAR